MTSEHLQPDTRLQALCHWLEHGVGIENPVPELLSADASFRRYFRLRGLDLPQVAMDAPPDRESLEDFVHIDRILHDLGMSVPLIHSMDMEQGFLLLEDLGNHRFSRALGAGADELGLYRLATDALIMLQTQWERQPRSDVPAYDEQTLLNESLLLLDWYWPEVYGKPCPAQTRQAFISAWREVLAPGFQLPGTLVLRDFHVDNLMVLAGRSGVAACGLLDFQDARIGNPAYDLVSLLRDARRDVSPGVAAAMKARHQNAFPHLNPRILDDSYWTLGAQRNTKIIGIFTRLWRRDDKPGYLAHFPRLWRLLEEELEQPALAPVRHWFDTWLPPAQRRCLDASQLLDEVEPGADD